MAMITWALKRQIIYIAILVLFFAVFGFLIIYPNLDKDPTCSDGKQNGEETGVDCGGGCLRACVVQVDEVSVLWARSFKVVPGRYNAVAYLINHNQNEAIEKINYRFRFADAKNVYIGQREGSTFVPPGRSFAVFEPGINLGSFTPVFVTFEFTTEPTWLQVSQEKINQLKVFVSNIVFQDADSLPRLSANIKNDSLFTIPEVGVVVILYDAQKNAISASRTYLEKLSPLESKDIDFTWREPFAEKVVEKEIIPMYNIFSAKLQ